MAIGFDLRAIRGVSKICYEPIPPNWKKGDFDIVATVDGQKRRVNPITAALIYASVAVGLPKLIDGNLDAWYMRLWMLQRLGPPVVMKNGVRYEITYDDLCEHVGLETSAEHLTTAQFLRTLTNYAVTALRQAKAAPEEADAAHG